MEPFSTFDPRRQGYTSYDIGEFLATGTAVRVRRGAFVAPRDADTLRTRAEALCVVLPEHAAICRRTAAWLWGLDVLPPGVDEHEWPVEVLVPAGATPSRHRGCRAYQADLPYEDIARLGATRVTSPERTAVDCARYAPRPEAVAALDQFLRLGVDGAALRERAAALAGRRNAAHLRCALDAADPNAESPGESWTRALIIDAGLPRPATQVALRLPTGQVYLDMGYAEFTTAVEHDGEEYHTRAEDARHDERRRCRIRDCGWEVIVVRKEHVLGDRRSFLHHLTATLLERGWRPSPAHLDDVLRRIKTLSTRPWTRELAPLP